MTETIDPGSFVEVFSPLLVHDTAALFQPGNVILIGTQGSGKSMLLTMLKPETRLAYANAGKSFPLDKLAGPFIGAGINLTRSGAIDFGQRPIDSSGVDAPEVLEAFFADFLNFWIVRDLLLSVQALSGAHADITRTLRLKTDGGRLNSLARTVAKDDCWAGALEVVADFAGLIEGVTNRIRAYRAFFNYNIDAIPLKIAATKTSAGEPISVTAEALRAAGVVPDNVEIFIRIDQYEELSRLEEWHRRAAGGSVSYAAVIHKMLGLRDPRVSYRIGTRRHSWSEAPRMQGTAAVLEEYRNYKVVDLDEILRSQEHRGASFPKFAEDVFRRRLLWAGYDCPPQPAPCIGAVLGASPDPHDEARLYAREGFQPDLRPEWPPSLELLIEDLAVSDPLAARFAEAYASQNGAEAVVKDSEGKYPWERRQWWRKERVSHALLQIAARQKQRMIWSGQRDVVNLSGNNVLAFVSLCQSIWDAWLRRPDFDGGQSSEPPRIPGPYTQDEGIQQASRYWHRKIRSDPDGDRRQRFVNLIGELFRDWLRSDLKMSYPGHNGFSVDVADLASDPEVRDFLYEAAAYGVLVDRLHTTRSRGGGHRHKWYLASIYAPYFQIPTAHVKEPKYVRTYEVRSWLIEAHVIAADSTRRRVDPADEQQPSLFD